MCSPSMLMWGLPDTVMRLEGRNVDMWIALIDWRWFFFFSFSFSGWLIIWDWFGIIRFNFLWLHFLFFLFLTENYSQWFFFGWNKGTKHGGFVLGCAWNGSYQRIIFLLLFFWRKGRGCLVAVLSFLFFFSLGLIVCYFIFPSFCPFYWKNCTKILSTL